MNVWKRIHLCRLFQMMMTAAQNTTETYFLPIQWLCVIMRLRFLWNHWPSSIEMIPVDMMPKLKLLDPIEIACFYHNLFNCLSTKVSTTWSAYDMKKETSTKLYAMNIENPQYFVIRHCYYVASRTITLLWFKQWDVTSIVAWFCYIALLHTPKYNEIAI